MLCEPWLSTISGLPNVVRIDAARLSIWSGRESWPHTLSHIPRGATARKGTKTTAASTAPMPAPHASSRRPRRRSVHDTTTGTTTSG